MATARLGAGVRDIRHLFEHGATVGVDDGQLLARYAANSDPAAFEVLVERHGPMVLATARAILHRDDDVEDVFQATFLVLARKAGSIRGGDALGGWLHRVAYRAAVQASKATRNRRKKEAEASAMATLDRATMKPSLDPDVKAILHEEIDRLPESGRLPIVLCDLEGCTYEEAARRLRWTVSIVRGRLAAARQKLRARLTRRGVAPATLGLLFAPGAVEARAVVPESLIRSAVSAGTGGSASATALILSRTVVKAMLMTKIKLAVAIGLATLAVGSAGVIAVGRIESRPGPPVQVIFPAPEQQAAAELAGPGEVVELAGRVVGPAGAPVAGARVVLRYLATGTSFGPEVVCGTDGRFVIRAPRSGLLPERFPRVVAQAAGFGMGAEPVSFHEVGELTVKLVEEGEPIEGRVVDLEGRAIADASVHVLRVAPGAVSITGGGGVSVVDSLPAAIETSADPDGRFRIVGIGRDRVATMKISGPSIASEYVMARTTPGPEVRSSSAPQTGTPWDVIQHAPKFDHVAAPTRLIRGVARDRDTGKPIAGLRIEAATSPRRGLLYDDGIEAITDVDGRYVIVGLPRADAYRLQVGRQDSIPAVPYLATSINLPGATPGVEPLTQEIILKRASVVRGRVTDKVTGRPVPGYVIVYTFPDNPAVADFPGYRNALLAKAYLDANGRYEIAAPPGRVMVACRSDPIQYMPARVDPTTPGYDATFRRFLTIPQSIMASNFHALADLVIEAKVEEKTADLELDPGRSVEVTVVDADGRPVPGTFVEGTTPQQTDISVERASPTFEVRCLGQGSPRRVTVTHDGRKLAGSVYLQGTETGPVTIRLQPWAEVTGRVIDAEGKPVVRYTILEPPGRPTDRPEESGLVPRRAVGGLPWVGEGGRFRIVGLVPGLKYQLAVFTVPRGGGGTIVRDLTLKQDEARELGDVKPVQIPPVAGFAKPAATGPQLAGIVEINGRVVGPDGAPIAGARIVPSFYESSIRPSPEATTGSDGRFSIRMAKSDRVAGRLDTSKYPWLVASAPGFGPGRVEGVERQGIGEVTIRLVKDDVPVEGRIVDLEGQPVVGARVKVARAFFAEDGDLGPWLAQLSNRGIQGIWSGLSLMPVNIDTTTGPDGRFKLVGVGRDRVASMVVSGPSIANSDVYAMTRPGVEMSFESGLMDMKQTTVIHPARFDHAAAPSKSIRGVVRDKDTGQPIAGMPIEGAVYDVHRNIPARDVDAVTDAEGRYTLIGLPKAESYRVFVGRGRERFLPYPDANFKAKADSPGLEPVTFDIALKRGAIVRGRVTNKATGKPVAGYVSAFTFAENPAIAEFPGYREASIQQAFLDADGRYELAAPPGRTLVACRSDMATYRKATGAEAIPGYDPVGRSFTTVPGWLGLANFHALADANLDPMAESTTVDLQVDPGRSIELTVLDPEGKPLGETKVEGASDLFRNIPVAQESPTFEVRSLNPGQPRRVTVTHEGRKLVGSISLKGDEPGPITVKLEPWGEVSGRIVDDEGKPLKGYGLGHDTGNPPGPLDELGVLPGGTMGGGIKVGNDGRFRVVGLVPGLKYGASALQGGEITTGLLFHDVTVRSGEARDLGDLKIEPRRPVAIKEEVAPGSVAIQGRVVGPDGRPVAGAKVVQAYGNPFPEQPEATSGTDGRFAIRLPGPRGSTGTARMTTYPWLVASSPRFGPGRVEGMSKQGLGEVAIKLAEEGPPIEGRIVDLEARPVAGARVQLWHVSHDEGSDFAAWTVQLAKVGNRAPSDGPTPIPTSLEATTGLDGRFRISGIAKNCAAVLVVSGPSIERVVLHATNRAGPAVVVAVEGGLPGRTGPVIFYPPGSDLAVAPSKPVRGVVRDKDSGRPIEGLRVVASANSRQGRLSSITVESTTDAQGQYALDGLVKAETYIVTVSSVPGQLSPYLSAGFRVAGDTPGLTPVTLDISLKRGVIVRGRVTDRSTDLPVGGQVIAQTFRDNPAVAEFPGFADGSLNGVFLNADGRYEITTVPGRNLITCRSDVTRYRTIVGAESIKGYDPAFGGIRTVPRPTSPANYHAIADVEVDPKAETVTVDMQVDPGRPVEITVVDPDGRPIGGTRVEGISAVPGPRPDVTQDSPSFVIRSLGPGEARRVTVTHDARKLVGSIYLKADVPGPITLKLEPWGELTGRLVDAEGTPIKGHYLSRTPIRNPARPEDVAPLPGGSAVDSLPVGADGRFRVVGLVPGLKYSASAASASRVVLGLLFRDATLKPGEVRDLGDLKIVRPSKE